MSKLDHPKSGLALAIEACGTKAELARRLGITRGAIQQWTRCPFHRAIDIERVTGVSRSLLCPNFFITPLNPDRRENFIPEHGDGSGSDHLVSLNPMSPGIPADVRPDTSPSSRTQQGPEQ